MSIIQILIYVTLGNTTVRTSLHKKHLGNFSSNTIYDINIKEHVCRLIGKKMQFYLILDAVIVVLLLTLI